MGAKKDDEVLVYSTTQLTHSCFPQVYKKVQEEILAHEQPLRFGKAITYLFGEEATITKPNLVKFITTTKNANVIEATHELAAFLSTEGTKDQLLERVDKLLPNLNLEQLVAAHRHAEQQQPPPQRQSQRQCVTLRLSHERHTHSW